MGIEVLFDSEKEEAVFVDNTVGVAFGPVFHSSVMREADEWAEGFLAWATGRSIELRLLTDRELSDRWMEYRGEMREKDRADYLDRRCKETGLGHF